MAHGDEDALNHPELRIGSRLGDFFGYAFTLVFMSLAFALVYTHALTGMMLESVLTLIAFVVIGVQLFLFTNLDISPAQRWKTIATILAIPLFFMVIGLTAWMFYTLSLRTGLPSVVH